MIQALSIGLRVTGALAPKMPSSESELSEELKPISLIDGKSGTLSLDWKRVGLNFTRKNRNAAPTDWRREPGTSAEKITMKHENNLHFFVENRVLWRVVDGARTRDLRNHNPTL